MAKRRRSKLKAREHGSKSKRRNEGRRWRRMMNDRAVAERRAKVEADQRILFAMHAATGKLGRD